MNVLILVVKDAHVNIVWIMQPSVRKYPQPSVRKYLMKGYVHNEVVRRQIWVGVFFEGAINILQFLLWYSGASVNVNIKRRSWVESHCTGLGGSPNRIAILRYTSDDQGKMSEFSGISVKDVKRNVYFL